MRIDPIRRLIVRIGINDHIAPGYEVYDINPDRFTLGRLPYPTKSFSGPNNLTNFYAPTLDYDSRSRQMVGWMGGKDVYSLDPATNAWIQVPAAPDSPAPPAFTENGVYGRWRYVPALNVFAVVTDVDNNVWIYKYSPDTADTTPPTVTSFTVPSSYDSRKVPINSFTAVDNVQVLSYVITESATPPSLTDAAWTAGVPSTYTVANNGIHTLYAYARDLAGNVSTAARATVMVSADITAPTVTAFAIGLPAQLNVPVTAFAATDNTGVIGYLITLSAVPPSPTDAAWTSSPPSAFSAPDCQGPSPVRLYAWARDAEGNISSAATVTATLNLNHTPGALLVGPHHPYLIPAAAAAAASAGSLIEIDAGDYDNDSALAAWTVPNLTIRGVGGYARMRSLDGRVLDDKAIWLQRADNLTVEWIEFSGATSSGENGSGLRNDAGAKGLIARNCYFHNNEDGILYGTGGTGALLDCDVLLESCEFAYNGNGNGFSHNIYIGRVRNFTLRYSYSHHAVIGHLVKSRAENNFILYNRLTDESTGTSSYLIDIPQGGYTYIIGNVLQKGPNSDASTMISYAREIGTGDPVKTWNAGREIYILNNSAVDERSASNGYGYFVRSTSDTSIVQLSNNLVSGSSYFAWWYPAGGDRQPTSNSNILTTTDPGFVSMASYDYRLKPTASLAIDQGQLPGTANGFNLLPIRQYVHPRASAPRAVNGRAIDIGAYELITGIASPTSLRIIGKSD
jgi:hypothetical protein